MAEYVTEILTGGLVLVIALWLIPIQISVRKLNAWKKSVEEEMPEFRRLTERE